MKLLNTKQSKMKGTMKEMEQDGHSLAGSYEGQVGITTKSKCEPIHAHNIAGYIQGTDFRITSYNVCYTKLLRMSAYDPKRTPCFKVPHLP